jgi:Rieske Fe-S protein
MSSDSTLDSSLSRRHMLLVGASAAAVACGPEASTPGADAMSTDITDVTPTEDRARDVSQPDAMITDAARPDASADVVRVDAPSADVVTSCTLPAGAVRVGPLSSFPAGRWVTVKKPGVILGRDARGIFAYTNSCTHEACIVPEPTSATTNSRCPCHRSLYNSDGAVIGGPALRSLENYAVILCEGDVYVDPTQVVPMGTRTSVA